MKLRHVLIAGVLAAAGAGVAAPSADAGQIAPASAGVTDSGAFTRSDWRADDNGPVDAEVIINRCGVRAVSAAPLYGPRRGDDGALTFTPVPAAPDRGPGRASPAPAGADDARRCGVHDYGFAEPRANGAVPEPASWLLMTLGVGAVGLAIRAARRRPAAIASVAAED